MSNNQDGFFAVNKERFSKALQLGINPAISYLVLACGTGRSNSKSKWSVNAIEKYAGIGRTRATKAIDLLISNRVIKKLNKTGLPRYQIVDGRKSKKLNADEVVWLPNGIVQGVASEMAPIARIRETKDTKILEMFIDLYAEQNLAADGCISHDYVTIKYTREILNERAQYVVYKFSYENDFTSWNNPLVEKHYSAEEGHNAKVFFSRLRTLETLNLIKPVIYLVDDREDGEIIHELDDDLRSLSTESASQMIPEYVAIDYGIHEVMPDLSNNQEVYIPVVKHIANAWIVGGYRTVYTARTKMTAEWQADYNKRKTTYTKIYNDILGVQFYKKERENNNLSIANSSL